MVTSFAWSTKSNDSAEQQFSFIPLYHMIFRFSSLERCLYKAIFYGLFQNNTQSSQSPPRGSCHQETLPGYRLRNCEHADDTTFCFTPVSNADCVSQLHFFLVLRMAQATPMTCGRWRCQEVRRVIWWKCYAAKSVLFTERPVVCFTPLARLCPSGKFTSCLLEMLICTSQEVKIFVFVGAGNRGRWPVAPIWKRLQTLSGTSRTMSILNVPATRSLHFCNCCYFRKSNTCLCFVAVPNISLSVLKPSFLEILLESHIVMIRVRKKRTHLSLQEKLSAIISWQIQHFCRATVV